MAYVALGNPIWSCQYRLQGGRRIFFKAFAYAALVVGIIILYHRIDGVRAVPSQTARMALEIGAWLQTAILILGGAAAIARALARDHTTHMIESYRIAPLSSFTVVTGYMFGATLQILLLYAVGVVLGLGLCFVADRSPQDWLVGNFYLLVVAASLWSIAVFAGMGLGKPGNLVPLLLLGSALSLPLMNFVPGLALWVGSYAVGLSVEHMCGRVGPASGRGVSLAVAVLLLVLWSRAAARRYRKPYLPALSIGAALSLVGAWLLVFLTGMRMLYQLIPGAWRMDDVGPAVRVITALSFLPMIHLPVAVAVQTRRRQILGARPTDWGERITPGWACVLSIALALVAVVALRSTPLPQAPAAGLSLAPSVDPGPRAWLLTAVTLSLAVATMSGLLRAAQFTTGRTVLATIPIVLLWSLPLLIDHVRVTITYNLERPTIEQYSFLLGCSPVASILGPFVYPTYVIWPGLVWQGVVAVSATLLGNRAERLLIKKRARLRAEETEQFGPPSPEDAGAEPPASLQPAEVGTPG